MILQRPHAETREVAFVQAEDLVFHLLHETRPVFIRHARRRLAADEVDRRLPAQRIAPITSRMSCR